MSLTKNQLKLITSLKQKKQRQKHKLFIAEGLKLVDELLNSNFELEQLFVLKGTTYFNQTTSKISFINSNELKKISNLKSPNTVLALFKIPTPKKICLDGLVLALDGINDPGNLGTIIRICDWFGIEQLLCSNNTVDCFNQKVVQATMGSLSRVNISYINLEDFIKTNSTTTYTADIAGSDIYNTPLETNAILVMGNEANGISDQINRLANAKLTIPRFGKHQVTESLNVATATAILISEFIGNRKKN